MKIIVSFCAECGSVVTGQKRCYNCNAPVEQRNQRLEGVFDEQDGKRLLTIHDIEFD